MLVGGARRLWRWSGRSVEEGAYILDMQAFVTRAQVPRCRIHQLPCSRWTHASVVR